MKEVSTVKLKYGNSVLIHFLDTIQNTYSSINVSVSMLRDALEEYIDNHMFTIEEKFNPTKEDNK